MMTWLRAMALTGVAVLASVMAARADDSVTLVERLHAADVVTALDTPDMKPWHLKMAVQLFDSAGKPTDEGSIEEWWDSPELDRTEYKTSTYSATEIRNGGKLYRTKGVSLPPYYLELLRRQIVHPMPRWGATAQALKPRLRKLSVGKVSLDCIELNQVRGEASDPSGSVPTYCLGVGTDSLRMTLMMHSKVVARNSVSHFLGREVSVEVVVSTDNKEAARGHVDALSTAEIPQATFAPSDETPEVTPRIVPSEGIKLNPVSQADVKYPEQAKANHVSGVVVTRAIIGTNGSVHELEVISSSSPMLTPAAIAAIRQWKYKPYVLNGVPTEVVTEIVTTFAIGGP